MQLLENLLVLDFSQFLSGPSASLRLADLGARVIKIERPGSGDLCRDLYVSDVMVDGESTIFHAINRNKESYEADLKDPGDLEEVKHLLERADVMIHNFRPGVMERIGLSYADVKAINPGLVYACVTGYGNEGEWKDRPGQDLLLQSVSGITFLSGNREDDPTPMGVAAADILAGTHLVQGILAALLRRFATGEGALIEVSMLESLLDFQFEVLTCFYNDGHTLPRRSALNSGHAYIAAPYGIYATAEGCLALAMGSIPELGRLLECDALLAFEDAREWYARRDEIKRILQGHLLTKPAREWLAVLEAADIWCAEVLDYDRLTQEEGYKMLEMEQEIRLAGRSIRTTRCPVRVDGQLIRSAKGAPSLGEHTALIRKEFNV